MHPTTHLLASWSVANVGGTTRRDRALITLSGVAPDLDGLGALVELPAKWLGVKPPDWYWFSRYHHVLGHNLLVCAVLTGACLFLATRRLWTAFFACLAFHLHLLCDIVGARGPDGSQWPIPYLSPFSRVGWTWEHQWPLVSWQNLLVTVALVVVTLALACRRGYSPLEIVSTRADAAVVVALRRRFGGGLASQVEKESTTDADLRG